MRQAQDRPPPRTDDPRPPAVFRDPPAASMAASAEPGAGAGRGAPLPPLPADVARQAGESAYPASWTALLNWPTVALAGS